MKIKEDIKPISYLKSRSAELLAQINETHRPVIITQNGEPRAVIKDTESYENMVKSLNLMKILAHSEKDIQEGNTIKQETLFKQIEDALLKKKIKKQTMKRLRVEWSRQASKDLLNIIDYMSRDSNDAAINIFEKIKSKCESLNQTPERGRIIPELKECGILVIMN